MAKVIQLKTFNEKNGQFIEEVHPKTSSAAVEMADGKTLQDAIDTLNSEILGVNTVLDELLEITATE